MKTSLISTNYIKEVTDIPEYINDKKLAVQIRLSQHNYTLPLLGSELMDKLLLDVSGNTLSGDYKVLVDDYIAPALAFGVVFDLYESQIVKVTNKGLQEEDSSTGVNADINKIIRGSRYYQSVKTSYEKSLVTHLEMNKELFPEYNTINSGKEEQLPTGKEISVFGWVFGSDDNKCNKC